MILISYLSGFDFLHYISINKRPESDYIRFHVTDDYKNEMAALKNPTCRELHISGLKQDSFEYFVSNYAQEFLVIRLAHCNLINNFSCLQSIGTLEYLMIDWNIRATKLWDMSQNTSLKGLYLSDVKKVNNLSDIVTAPNLKELAIDETVDSQLGSNKWRLASLSPIQNAPRLEKLFLVISKIEDESILPLLQMAHLKKLHITTSLFTLEDFATLNAKLKNTSVKPDRPFYINENDESDLYALVVGKGRAVKRNSPKLVELQKRWDDILSQT